MFMNTERETPLQSILFTEDTSLPFDSPKFDFRDVFSIFYLPLDCPLGKKCPMHLCPLSHTTLEKIFHPIIYKTKPCQKTLNGSCEYDRKCSFHHGALDRARSDLLWQKWEKKWEGWRESIKTRFKEKYPPHHSLHNKLDSIMKVRDWKDTLNLSQQLDFNITNPSQSSYPTFFQNPLMRGLTVPIDRTTTKSQFLPDIVNSDSLKKNHSLFLDNLKNENDINNLQLYNFTSPDNSQKDKLSWKDETLSMHKKLLSENPNLQNELLNQLTPNKASPPSTGSDYNDFLEQMINNQNWYSEFNQQYHNDIKNNFQINSADSTTASPTTPANSSPARSCFSMDPNMNFLMTSNQTSDINSQVQLPSAISSLPHLSHTDLCVQCAYLKKMSLMFYKAYIEQLQGCSECSHHLTDFTYPTNHKFNELVFDNIHSNDLSDQSLQFPSYPQKRMTNELPSSQFSFSNVL